MSETMKPCPFCGTRTHLFFQRTHPDLSEGHIKCDRCDAQGPEQASEKPAILAWNAAPRRAKKGTK